MAGRVGIVGIGIMGTAMMRNLLRHSFVLHSMTIWPVPLLEAMPPWARHNLLKGIDIGQRGDQDLLSG